MRFDNFDYDYAVVYFKFLKIQSDYFYKISDLQTYKQEVHQRIRSIETLTTWTLAVRAIPVK